MRRIALVIVAVIAFAAPGAPATEALDRLERAVAAHPDDPDLAWARSRALLESRRYGEAVAALAAFEARWPSHRPDIAYARGRALYGAGRTLEALAAFERELRRDPGHAQAHLYRGLSLRRLGQGAEADAALREAAALESELAGDALLLQIVGHVEEGRFDAGRQLAEELAGLGASPESLARARQLLARGDSPSDPPLRVAIFGGYERDSNVTLDSGDEASGLTADQRDWVASFGGGLSWRAVRGERTELAFAYHFLQREHDHLDGYDEELHSALAAGTWHLSEAVALRLDSRFTWSRLDHRGYSHSASLRPNLFLRTGERGVLRLHAEGERISYRNAPSRPSLERDGVQLGAGVEYRRGWPWPSGAWSSVGASFQRSDKRGGRDADGLANAYERDRFGAQLRMHVPLVADFAWDGRVGLDRERYHHENVLDFLLDDGVGTATPRKRRDTALRARLQLTRPLGRFTDLELAWSHLQRISNVDVYEYERDVLGLYLRLHSF